MTTIAAAGWFNGWGMGHMMGGGMGRGGWGGMGFGGEAMLDRMDGRLAFLKTELKNHRCTVTPVG
jgi:hypothetical protein